MTLHDKNYEALAVVRQLYRFYVKLSEIAQDFLQNPPDFLYIQMQQFHRLAKQDHIYQSGSVIANGTGIGNGINGANLGNHLCSFSTCNS